ncbi:MAG: fatty acid desaturase [Spongiibacteraceae bacterium]
MSRVRGYLRDPAGLWPNTAALTYAIAGYVIGWWCMFHPSLSLNVGGAILLGHAMIIAAYLIHDCAHNAIFKNPHHNVRLGAALNWLTGGCYGRFEDLRYKHLRHHNANADLISFDYRVFLLRHPRLLRVVSVLEWFYIPAVEILMHAVLTGAPLVLPGRAAQRTRVVTVIIIRVVLLVGVALVSLKAFLFYLLAQGLLLTVLRFMDAFQHTYAISLLLDDRDAGNEQRGNRAYEEANTYSNLISTRWPWLNLLTLNFAYHNAHHAHPIAGWYRLPQLHDELYPQDCAQQVLFVDQLRCFHRHRVARVLGENDDQFDMVASTRAGAAVGAAALSFLTAF